MDQRERIPDFQEALRTAFEGMMSEMWFCLPAVVQSFNKSAMTCTATCPIQFRQQLSDGTYEWIQMTLLVDLPILYQGGGGIVLTFAPKQGDEAIVFFADRCIDGWWDKGQTSIQLELRLHSISDGFIFVGPKSLPNVIENISDGAQLRTINGAAYIQLDLDGTVTIVTPTSANITAAESVNITAVEDVDITATGVNITAEVLITGDLTVTGQIYGNLDGGGF